jgi:16S rRNA (guanine1516-N2)-methyltransferase
VTPAEGALRVDFVTGAVAHRLRFGGGRGQDLAKAMGLRAGKTPKIVDATAGPGPRFISPGLAGGGGDDD